MLRLLFRKQNYLLFMAASINLSLLYAPLAYAANYSQNIYAWLRGSSITIERTDPLGGAANFSSVTFTGDWMLFIFAALTTILGLSLVTMMFINRRPAFKKRVLLTIFFLLLLQAFIGWQMETHLTVYLGKATPGDIETRLQAQYWLHLFPPLFTWWAWHNVRRTIRRTPPPSGKTETITAID